VRELSGGIDAEEAKVVATAWEDRAEQRSKKKRRMVWFGPVRSGGLVEWQGRGEDLNPAGICGGWCPSFS
jgi:hypothetical protein